MAKFLLRRLVLMLLTMFLVSIAVFAISEAAPGNIARNVLGHQVMPEQEAAFLAQNGLDRPLLQRYVFWLLGSDWLAARRVNLPVTRISTEEGFWEWWAELEDGSLGRWELVGEDLTLTRLLPDGSEVKETDNQRWQIADPTAEIERLEAHRGAVLDSPQLSDADRDAIVERLDAVLVVLRETEAQEMSSEALAAALATPEASLTAMMAAEAGSARSALESAADEAAKKVPILLATDVHRVLSETGAGDLGVADLQAMARQLDRVAKSLEDMGAAGAPQVREASAHLMGEDPTAAENSLGGVLPGIETLSLSLGSWLAALRDGDYVQAVSTLEGWSARGRCRSARQRPTGGPVGRPGGDAPVAAAGSTRAGGGAGRRGRGDGGERAGDGR